MHRACVAVSFLTFDRVILENCPSLGILGLFQRWRWSLNTVPGVLSRGCLQMSAQMTLVQYFLFLWCVFFNVQGSS